MSHTEHFPAPKLGMLQLQLLLRRLSKCRRTAVDLLKTILSGIIPNHSSRQSLNTYYRLFSLILNRDTSYKDV
jgi:hypothetical protein